MSNLLFKEPYINLWYFPLSVISRWGPAPPQQKRTRGARDPGTSAPGARRAICFGTNAISERTLGKGSEYLDDLRSGDWVALITSLVKIAST